MTLVPWSAVQRRFRENLKEAWLWDLIKFGVGILELETAYELPHEVI